MKKHQYAPMSRLTEPLVRDNGVLRPATWEEALDRAAAGFVAARDGHGPNAVGVFSCSKSTNEMTKQFVNIIAQEFDCKLTRR